MGETNEWSSLGEEQRPKFYMIIHNSVIQDGSIELPAKFVKKIEKDPVDDDGVAVLKVPSGVEWRVKMTRKSDGGVWFSNGIPTFIDCYSISAGHFLFFRYDGNSQFHVVIFNMRGSEIEYHLFEDDNNSNSNDSTSHSNEAENMECFEIQGSQEEHVDYMETLSGDSSPDRDESDEDNDEDEVAKKKPSKLAGSKRKSRSLSSSNPKEYVVRANEIERSFASTSTNPFFRIIVQTSYVEHKYMPIPWTFIRYFPEDLKDVKVVAVSDRREWKIRVLRSKTDLKLNKGVADFMNKKNGLNLKVGDVLIFEIVKRRYLVLKVHVFPATG
ncbi:B3 domain-containing transcription factor VRN1-like [Papaver somniferum]|uniref:B3 domain-containing transcription factor VRN1-like n=1 Tax=Papaver somniferum TaxID=3469 RepID=UPI000E702615|nr:B3 domain-containing transcription factor VRN1-like [Papaver somniferum]